RRVARVDAQAPSSVAAELSTKRASESGGFPRTTRRLSPSRLDGREVRHVGLDSGYRRTDRVFDVIAVHPVVEVDRPEHLLTEIAAPPWEPSVQFVAEAVLFLVCHVSHLLSIRGGKHNTDRVGRV